MAGYCESCELLMSNIWYCPDCYGKVVKLKKDFETQSQKKIEKQETIIKNCQKTIKILEEEIALLRKWSFVPWEVSESGSASGTRDYVTVSCNSDGSRFQAHSLVLANRSEVFRKLLEEVDFRKKEAREVIIQEVGGESVEVFLKFLHTAEMSAEDMHANYRELVKLAHSYEVKMLLVNLDKFICKEFLREDTLTELTKMAYLYDLETTRKAAQILIADLNEELFDIALKELHKDHPWIALDLSMYIFNRYKKRSKAK